MCFGLWRFFCRDERDLDFFHRVALKADMTSGHSGEMQQIELQRNKKHYLKENYILEGVSLKL